MMHRTPHSHPLRLWICGLALLAGAKNVYAPPPVPRYALVIGNSKHQDQRLGTLRTTRNDAEDMAKELGKLGYQVTEQYDIEMSSLKQAVSSFSTKVQATSNALAVFYFAGHGLQDNGRDFLLPTNFDTSQKKTELDKVAVAVDRDLIKGLSGRSGASVIILDACRKDPLREKKEGGGEEDEEERDGLAQVDNVPNGTLVELSAEPNRAVIESLDTKAPDRNSIFAKQLLKKLENPSPDIDIRHFFDMVGNNVYEVTNHDQKPRVITAPTPPAMPAKVSLAPDGSPNLASEEEVKSWKRVAQSSAACAFEYHLRHFPNGAFADSCRATINAIQSKLESAPDAFAKLPPDLKAQVTKTFQEKQKADEAECSHKWADTAPADKPSHIASLRQASSSSFLARPAVYHPNNGRFGGALEYTPTLSRQTHSAHLLKLALEEDAETRPAAVESSRQVSGDEEFQADLLSAEQGEINAMYRIAIIYEEGSHGVEQNKAEMLRWLAMSSSLGDGLASYKLYRYFSDQSTGYAKAVKYKSLASKQGYYGPVTLSDKR